jgi:predicted nucleic acid-binding Zn ribbon protein
MSKPKLCVVCGKVKRSQHVDTCGERCFKTLLRRQRDVAFPETRAWK